MNTFLPEAEYYAKQPRKIIAAGVVFVDVQGRVLIVETTYKAVWEIPGGVVEAGESLLESAVRELKEELNLAIDRTALRLVTTDYKHAADGRPESIQFHFWGGVIDPALITVDNDEISSFMFVIPSELDQYCTPTLARRTQETVKAVKAGRSVYLEDGYPLS